MISFIYTTSIHSSTMLYHIYTIYIYISYRIPASPWELEPCSEEGQESGARENCSRGGEGGLANTFGRSGFKWLQQNSTNMRGSSTCCLISLQPRLQPFSVAHDGAFTQKWMPIQLDCVFWSSNVSHTNSERLLVRKLDRTHPQAHRY